MSYAKGFNLQTGEWNDSLLGDFLWSSVNVSEAVPDVMTPSTWSLWQIFHRDANPIKVPGNYPFCGNICGRPYLNLSLVVSLYRAVGKDITLWINGAVTSEFKECEALRGYIGLEAEGYRVEYRNVQIKPVE